MKEIGCDLHCATKNKVDLRFLGFGPLVARIGTILQPESIGFVP